LSASIAPRRVEKMNEIERMDEIKNHLVHVSAQLVELRASLSRLETHSGIKEAAGIATPLEMSCAVTGAIRGIRATSLEHLDAVERAARVSLEAKAFDGNALRGLIRGELE
jgi:hypothetical protein